MNTHDIDIELPPLPTIDVMGKTLPQIWFTAAEVDALRRAAIEADRQRRGEPSSLAEVWRINADEAEAYGQSDRADTLRECAAEVERLAAPQPLSESDIPADPTTKESLAVAEPVECLVRDDMLGTWLFRWGKPEPGLRKYAKPLYTAPQPAEPVKHDLYKTGDPDAPEQILDRNGVVVLQCCKRCGKAEAELSGPCEPVKVDASASVPSDDALVDALINLEYDNYEQSFSGYKNRQADVELIRSALARYGE